MKYNMKIKIQLLIGIIAIVSLMIVGNLLLAFGTVSEDEVHVETNWGESTGTTYDSGQYWLGDGILPNGLSYSTDSVNVEPITMTESVDGALSRDGQDIGATVSVTYQVDGEQASSFYSDSEKSAPFRTTNMWEERVGERAIQSSVQDAASSVSALEIIQSYDVEDGADISTLRTELQSEVEEQLLEETDELSPEVDIVEVRIEEASLSQELDAGLEEIAIEEANAERIIIEAEAEADSERAIAEGQADAFETIKEAYGGEEEALQAEWIEAINEDDGTIIIDAEAAPILDLNEEDINGD